MVKDNDDCEQFHGTDEDQVVVVEGDISFSTQEPLSGPSSKVSSANELSLCSKEKEEKWKSPKDEILKRVLLLYKAEKEPGKAYRCDLPSDDETIYSSGKEINTSQLIIWWIFLLINFYNDF